MLKNLQRTAEAYQSKTNITSNSKSKGGFISVSKITLADDLDVESWTADRHATRKIGMCSSQSIQQLAHYFSQVFLQDLIKSLYHSIDAKRINRVFLIPYISYISMYTADSKCLSWSECSSIRPRTGIPSCSLIHLLLCSPLDWVLHIPQAICWNNPSRKKYRFPALLTGKGHATSIAIR